MKSIVSEKGQVTIPKSVRDQLGLRPGTVLEFRARGGELAAAKAVEADTFTKWRGRGRLPMGTSVDDYLRASRGGG